jgi:hypothetical protein
MKQGVDCLKNKNIEGGISFELNFEGKLEARGKIGGHF